MQKITDQCEWLETDGLGGFASGAVSTIRSRRYHSLLTVAVNPPAGRRVMLNAHETFVVTPRGEFPLSSHRYAGPVVHPEGRSYIISFESNPWPTWRYRLPDGTQISHELFMVHGRPLVAMSWRRVRGTGPVKLVSRPLMSGRDFHDLHHENSDFQFQPLTSGETLQWRAYPGAPQPPLNLQTNGRYTHDPLWYRNFEYEQERERGFASTEDLASPGRLEWDLEQCEAVCIYSAEDRAADGDAISAKARMRNLRLGETRRRASFASPLHRAADQYIVRRGNALSIIAGYPWFGDWGRDTFIAVRGLCMAAGRWKDAASILLNWSEAIRDGLIPNRFPDTGEAPEYNSVDAGLWFTIAAHELLCAVQRGDLKLPRPRHDQIIAAVKSVLHSYIRGTLHGIRPDADGLLACGAPGVQLTWMDAKIGDWVVTPRIGKPVEVQALWINALMLWGRQWPDLLQLGKQALATFRVRFWNAQRQCLYDVIDVDHQPGTVDATIRPNQVYAIGGLPRVLITGARAACIVDVLESKLWTPAGLRSLAPDEPGYTARYAGGPAQRDAAYHQGTVWPFLTAAFVEAWLGARGSTASNRQEARRRFLDPLRQTLSTFGLNHVSEIADGESPHRPNGCPFQAWSVGELLRLERCVLPPETAAAAPVTHTPEPSIV